MTNDRGYNLVVRSMWCFLREKRCFNKVDSPNYWTKKKMADYAILYFML